MPFRNASIEELKSRSGLSTVNLIEEFKNRGYTDVNARRVVANLSAGYGPVIDASDLDNMYLIAAAHGIDDIEFYLSPHVRPPKRENDV